MTKQLTVLELIGALNSLGGNRLVIIAGFGAKHVPGDLGRHRPYINDVGIEVVEQRMNPNTVERFTKRLHDYATQPVKMWNPNPATLDSPAWIIPSYGETTFWAVTGVLSFSGHAVIRAEDVAPVQGPSLQRISDDEVLRRRSEIAPADGGTAGLDPTTNAAQRLIAKLPGQRTATKLRLEQVHAQIRELQQEIPRLETEAARIDYLLGITDSHRPLG